MITGDYESKDSGIQVPFAPEFVEDKVSNDPSDNITPQSNTSVEVNSTEFIQEDLDDKTARMVEFLASGGFSKTDGFIRMHILLLTWVIRRKIVKNMKRTFDFVLAVFLFLLTSPIMILTAILIKLESPGPIIYKQERVGMWGKHFLCYKFRSMHIDADLRKAELMDMNEADQVVFKIKNDPRVTSVGRVIRKLSVDELPQFLNVIKGEMSLVGPRPPVPYEVDQYKFDTFRRLDAIPGITGLQQVSGRSELEFQRWVELDLQYIQEQSLLKDIEILIRTIPSVISGKGAY